MSKKALLFLAYALPYPFLAMWEDATFGTAWCYGLSILLLILLCRISIKRKLTKTMLAGNALSLLLSLLLVSLFRTEKWLWYFTPFTPLQMPLFLTALTVLLELFALRVTKGGADANQEPR